MSLLDQYTESIKKTAEKEAIKREEIIAEILPHATNILSVLLAILVVVTPYAIGFLLIPLANALFKYLTDRPSYVIAKDETKEVTVTELNRGEEEGDEEED